MSGNKINVDETLDKMTSIINKINRDKSNIKNMYSSVNTQYRNSKGEFYQTYREYLHKEEACVQASLDVLIKIATFIKESTISYEQNDQKISKIFGEGN
ncbi:hypothetical protein [Listeria ilorinensis]|uniref:hypothetical protein n=1 Tax=Listeria ilorinensis TaxID=2867439 RepID=UPI001EF540FC|nr:hypothetical protein [Listeria ilorinensis]